MNKYMNIHISSEPQVGIIEIPLTDKEFSVKNKKLNARLTEIIEPKLVEALQSHFDVPVKIRLTEITNHTPLAATVTVIVESEDEDYEETAILDETWLY